MPSGDTSEAGDGCGGPDESFLFLLTSALTPESDCPEMELAARQRRLLFDRFGAPSTPLENLAACFIRTPGRTHHRLRSPRFAASSRWKNVVKGSRQNRSVPSEKGLALRVGPRGLLVKVVAAGPVCFAVDGSGGSSAVLRNPRQ